MIRAMPPADPGKRLLLLFTKPARAGRVKTRLIGDLSAREAAELHAAFLDDLVERLAGGAFTLRLLWALEPGRQEGAGLGDRLYDALSAAAREAPFVAALGSDHPTLPVAVAERAFAALEAGADAVLGPAEDGGYYLIALRAAAVRRRLFEDVPWSTPGVLAATLERCRELGFAWELLPEAADVDTPDDLRRLAAALAAGGDLGCPRTRGLLAAWDRLPAAASGAGIP